MYAGVFIVNYAKNMTLKEHHSVTMELLRTKGTRFYGILQSSVIPRLKLDNQILLLLIKPRRIAEIVIPGDVRVNEREVGKTEKYEVLKYEITRMWDMKKVIVIPAVVGALGVISTGFEKYVAAIGIELYWGQRGF